MSETPETQVNNTRLCDVRDAEPIRIVEDLVGVFSIEKNIKVGSSAECFSSSETTSDPLSLSDKSNAMDDTLAPSLANLSLMPISAENNSNQINITAHIIDDQSGIKGAQVWFRSPSGRQFAEVCPAGERVETLIRI